MRNLKAAYNFGCKKLGRHIPLVAVFEQKYSMVFSDPGLRCNPLQGNITGRICG